MTDTPPDEWDRSAEKTEILAGTCTPKKKKK